MEVKENIKLFASKCIFSNTKLPIRNLDKCDDKEFYLQTQALEEDVGIRGVVQGDRVMDGSSGSSSSSSRSSSGSRRGGVSRTSSVVEDDDEFENYNDS